jgi:hypothetical protein
MTRDEYTAKIEELIPQVAAGLARAALSVADTCPDYVEEAPDNFTFPKAAICAALRAEVNQWRPLGGETREERRLMHVV